MVDFKMMLWLKKHRRMNVTGKPQTAITKFDGVNAYLSNFYPCAVRFGGMVFESSEAAYQAAKCADPSQRVRFVAIPAMAAKRLGRKVELRSDWEEKKVALMRRIVAAKFHQHRVLRLALEETDPAELVEGNYWHDTFWGVCEGEGQNVLGNILMDLRNDLLIPF